LKKVNFLKKIEKFFKRHLDLFSKGGLCFGKFVEGMFHLPYTNYSHAPGLQ
jgi:hypothetical protein